MSNKPAAEILRHLAERAVAIPGDFDPAIVRLRHAMVGLADLLDQAVAELPGHQLQAILEIIEAEAARTFPPD